MGGGAYYITMPENGTNKSDRQAAALGLRQGRHSRGASPLDASKGGVGKIIEYGGEGVKTLSVPERATITNMGAELGATTSIFPSDEVTREFLKAQGREAGLGTPLRLTRTPFMTRRWTSTFPSWRRWRPAPTARTT